MTSLESTLPSSALTSPKMAEDADGSEDIMLSTPSLLVNENNIQSTMVAVSTQEESNTTQTEPTVEITEKDPGSSTTISKSVDTSTATSNEDIIDSALLSALRDPRERIALFKLEQVLVDFLQKQPQDSYIDVGGAYNAMVISPTLGYIGVGVGGLLQQQQQQQSQQIDSNTSSLVLNRPQTTFHRCILHRLCDRFHMTREKSYIPDSFGNYYIRVCKTYDTKMPPRLLLNVEPSEYTLNSSDEANHSTSVNSNFVSSLEQMNLSSENGGKTTTARGLSASIATNSAITGKSSSKNRKMKIMKRSDSSNISSNGSDTNTKASSKKKNLSSSLSEKEKKYAEARARIFQQEQETSEDVNGNNVVAPSSSSSTPVTDDIPAAQNGAVDASLLGQTDNDLSSNLNTRNTSFSRSGSGVSDGDVLGNEKEDNNNNNGEADTMSGAQTRSKATYRNRQQEEADPDFRRGVGMVMIPPSAAMAAPFVPMGYGTGSAGVAPPVYYPNAPTVRSTGTGREHTTVAASATGRGYYAQQQQQQQQQQLYSQYYAVSTQHYAAAPAVGGGVFVAPGQSAAGATTYHQPGGGISTYSPSRGKGVGSVSTTSATYTTAKASSGRGSGRS